MLLPKILIYLEGGALASLNFGNGRGGDINLRVAQELKFDGFNPIIASPSNVNSTVYRTGDSGSITIDAGKILLFNGAKISTATLAEGDAGQLTINATESIEINGTTSNERFESSIASDGEILPLGLQQLLGVPNVPSGNSGNVTVNTPRLTVSDGGKIAVNNKGLGDSGSLKIQSDRITLDNNASISAFSTSGQGGNIDLQVQDWLSLNDRSVITAQTTARSTVDRFNINGGNINIDTDIVTLLKNSEINASAIEGRGGNVNVTTKGLFVSTDSLVSASSEFGLDGTVEVEILNSDRQFELGKLSENTIGGNQQITKGCSNSSEFAIVGKGGLPANPTQNLRGQVIWQDLRLIGSELSYKNEHTEFDVKQDSTQSNHLVEAQGWKVNQLGKVELFARNRIEPSFRDLVTCN